MAIQTSKLSYDFAFHAVASVNVTPVRTCGTEADAFAVRDIELLDSDGQKLRITVYSDRKPNPVIPVTVS